MLTFNEISTLFMIFDFFMQTWKRFKLNFVVLFGMCSNNGGIWLCILQSMSYLNMMNGTSCDADAIWIPSLLHHLSKTDLLTKVIEYVNSEVRTKQVADTATGIENNFRFQISLINKVYHIYLNWWRRQVLRGTWWILYSLLSN